MAMLKKRQSTGNLLDLLALPLPDSQEQNFYADG